MYIFSFFTVHTRLLWKWREMVERKRKKKEGGSTSFPFASSCCTKRCAYNPIRPSSHPSPPPLFFFHGSRLHLVFFFAAKEGRIARCTRDQIRNQPGARRCAFILIWVFFKKKKKETTCFLVDATACVYNIGSLFVPDELFLLFIFGTVCAFHIDSVSASPYQGTKWDAQKWGRGCGSWNFNGTYRWE